MLYSVLFTLENKSRALSGSQGIQNSFSFASLHKLPVGESKLLKTVHSFLISLPLCALKRVGALNDHRVRWLYREYACSMQCVAHVHWKRVSSKCIYIWIFERPSAIASDRRYHAWCCTLFVGKKNYSQFRYGNFIQMYACGQGYRKYRRSGVLEGHSFTFKLVVEILKGHQSSRGISISGWCLFSKGHGWINVRDCLCAWTLSWFGNAHDETSFSRSHLWQTELVLELSFEIVLTLSVQTNLM